MLVRSSIYASSIGRSSPQVAMDFLSTPIATSIALIFLAIVLVVIRSHARRTGTDEKKKKYHPVATHFFKTLMNFSRLHHYMTEFEHKYKSYRAFNYFIDYVITTDPINIEYILKTKHTTYVKGWYHEGVLSDVLGEGIFAVDGEKWLHQRKVSSNELSAKVVKDFSLDVFKSTALKLHRIMSEAATTGQSMEIQDLFMRATSDSIVKVLLGIELDTLYGTNKEGIRFAHAFDLANEMTIYRYVDFSWKIRRFLNIGSEAVLRKNVKVIDEFMYKLIKTKSETIHTSALQQKKGDMISRLLESDQTDPKYLRDMLLCLIAAGRDTTASTLTWFIYMVSKNPHLQEKIVQEVREVTNMPDSSTVDEVLPSLTEETLEKMHFLHATLSETLRLYPAVPINAKVCLADDTWPDGFSVKKGDFVGFHLYGMGRMKYLWGDDAEEFRPERWLDENGHFRPESPFKFPVFNAGPRICIGRDFSYKQTKIICAMLLRSYIFKLRDENKVAKYKMMISLHIDGGLYVQVSPRPYLA